MCLATDTVPTRGKHVQMHLLDWRNERNSSKFLD
jgi:hypothetical protein